jgi:hypothetical protein
MSEPRFAAEHHELSQIWLSLFDAVPMLLAVRSKPEGRGFLRRPWGLLTTP